MGKSDGNKICGEAVNSKIEDLSPKEITPSVSGVNSLKEKLLE